MHTCLQLATLAADAGATTKLAMGLPGGRWRVDVPASTTLKGVLQLAVDAGKLEPAQLEGAAVVNLRQQYSGDDLDATLAST